MSPVCCNVPAKWIRLVCLVVFFAVVLSSLPVHLKHDSVTAQGSRPRRTQGPPSRNLPNLDETRRTEPGTPRIMPPVPATKCRGRDEKCKKAKGKISSNLPGNKDRLLAYADYRPRRDHAGWLKIVIPALSMLDDLIYGSARMISDFPDIPYRSHGYLLTESAVKLTNPRNETYGGSALGGPRKGYSRVGRSLVTAQSGGVVNPTANQTPDSGQGGTLAVTGISNTGHGSTTTSTSVNPPPNSNQSDSQARSARWSSFQSGGPFASLTLKFDWTANGNVQADTVFASSASAGITFVIQFSINGGSSWTTKVAKSRSAFVWSNGSGSDSINESGSEEVVLSPSQDISQVQVRDRMDANASAQTTNNIETQASASASITTTISNIRLEVGWSTALELVYNLRRYDQAW